MIEVSAARISVICKVESATIQIKIQPNAYQRIDIHREQLVITFPL